MSQERRKRPITKEIAISGMLIGLAIILSYVESLVPAFFAIPGMKLGLTNVVVLFALYQLNVRSAVFINLIRIFIVGVLFGTGISLAYSMAGGILALLAMCAGKKLGAFRIVTVSVVGGIFHNIGQILVAMAVLGTSAVAWYLPILWFTGIGAGAVVGILGAILVGRLGKVTDNMR